MQKVLSPAPKTLYSPNWPALKSKSLAHGLVLELQAQRARVGGLVDHLGDGGRAGAGRCSRGRLLGLGGVARTAGGDVDRLQDLDEVLAGVADARAAAAAGAEHLAELERVDGELVVDALAVAGVLVVARVVAAGVQREGRRLAGVPAAAPGAAADALLLVDDVEAVAGGADAGAGAAAVAADRQLRRAAGPRSACRSSRGREAASISRLAATRCAGGRALVVGLAAERVGLDVAGEARLVGLGEGAPLVGRRLVRRSRRRPA